MPEGPEVRVISEVFQNAIGRIITNIDHSHDEKHKWERDGIPGWDLLKSKPGWWVTRVETKGKLIRVDFRRGIKIPERLSMLNTLGLEGFWAWENTPSKHRRVWFDISIRRETKTLAYVDSRNFGTIRFMTPEEADKKMAKIGWDLLDAPMATRGWRALQAKKSLAKKPIGDVLMKQNHFSGIGNIYKAETLYDLKINPTTLVEDVDPALWDRVNHSAHSILKTSYQKKGSSVKSYGGGSFQKSLKIYKKKICPNGHPTASIKQSNRTTWFCPTCQP